MDLSRTFFQKKYAKDTAARMPFGFQHVSADHAGEIVEEAFSKQMCTMAIIRGSLQN